jgi:hypothetical protein
MDRMNKFALLRAVIIIFSLKIYPKKRKAFGFGKKFDKPLYYFTPPALSDHYLFGTKHNSKIIQT